MPPPLAPTRWRGFLLLVSVFTLFLSVFVATASSDIYGTGDTGIRIQVAQNFTGRLSLSMYGWKLQQPRHQKKEQLDPRITRGRNNLTYSTYLPGQPLLVMPLDIAGTRLAVHERWPFGPALYWFDRLVGPIIGAFEVLIFFVFAVRLSYGRRVAFALTSIFAFATMCWPDEQSVNEHTVVAFSLLVGWYAAFRYRDQHAPPWYLLLAGVGIGGAFITRYQDAAVALAGLGVYLLLPRAEPTALLGRARDCVLVGIGLLPFALLILWYNWVRFGSITATGHHESTFGYAIWLGASGLLFSPGKGLIWYCPTVVLLLFAGRPFFRRYGALLTGFAVMSVLIFTLYGAVTFWHGDPTWGPRYVYPIVPFLTLPLGMLLPAFRRLSWTSAITGLVIAVSLLVQVSAVSVSEWRSWYRVIAYEEAKGYPWQWQASRYRYFWNPAESPLNYQLHGLYQMTYDALLHTSHYEIVPPVEDGTLDNLSFQYSINQWNFWWKSDELSWWMGRQKIVAALLILAGLGLASGTYIASEFSGVWDEPEARRAGDEPLEVAA
jgi:hypothetical protein